MFYIDEWEKATGGGEIKGKQPGRGAPYIYIYIGTVQYSTEDIFISIMPYVYIINPERLYQVMQKQGTYAMKIQTAANRYLPSSGQLTKVEGRQDSSKRGNTFGYVTVLSRPEPTASPASHPLQPIKAERHSLGSFVPLVCHWLGTLARGIEPSEDAGVQGKA